jgi:cytoskeletal protein CcmA (bactofilin family)
VELAKTARITGDITHETLAVEAGAFVEGRFNRMAPKGAKPAETAVIKMAAVETGADIAPAEEDAPKANVIMLGN